MKEMIGDRELCLLQDTHLTDIQQRYGLGSKNQQVLLFDRQGCLITDRPFPGADLTVRPHELLEIIRQY